MRNVAWVLSWARLALGPRLAEGMPWSVPMGGASTARV